MHEEYTLIAYRQACQLEDLVLTRAVLSQLNCDRQGERGQQHVKDASSWIEFEDPISDVPGRMTGRMLPISARSS